MRDGPAFVQVFTHEVEAEAQGTTFWLPWQASLVPLFQQRLATGGALTAHLLLAVPFISA